MAPSVPPPQRHHSGDVHPLATPTRHSAHRPHAATISTSRPANALLDTPRSYRPPLNRKPSTVAKPWDHLESLTKDELSIVDTRFDLMSDDELYEYLQNIPVAPEDPTPRVELSAPVFPANRQTSSSAGPSSTAQLTPSGDKSPLFPPSPPSLQNNAQITDHPLRVLSRAVRELREVIGKLEEENARLRMNQVERKPSSGKATDQISIHDDLNEAISTSLTSTPSLREIPSRSSALSIPQPGLPSLSPTTSRFPAGFSPSSSSSVPFTSTPVDLHQPDVDAASINENNDRRSSRQSWTSGLWIWGNKKSPVTKRSSMGSIVSANHPVPPSPNAIPRSTPEHEDEDETWRKGDGGSSPSYRAIFLATRILTPDPSSILIPTETPPKPLIAQLAHSLVRNARDEGIVAKEPMNHRRSRDLSRSRAISLGGRERSQTDETRNKDSKAHGDSALSATALLGRSLLSSVTGATIRGSRSGASVVNEEIRPSILSRGSSGHGLAAAPSSPAISHSAAMGSPPSEAAPLPSVELSSIVPDESRPPTVLLSRENLGSFFQSNRVNRAKMVTASRFESDKPPLTDRYGFIYDIQHAKMLKDASVAGTPAPMSLNGTLFKNDDPEEEGWIAKHRRGSHGSQKSDSKSIRNTGDVRENSQLASPRPSIDSASSNTQPPSRSSDTPESVASPKTRSRSSSHADQHRHRSSTILSLNPSPARPVTGKDHLTVSARGSSSLHSGISPTIASTTAPQPISASLSKPISPIEASTNVSRVTISSLLDQLTDLHDRQQKERVAEWDVFIKKRAKSRAADKGRGWTAGLIGVSQMGLSGKGQEDWRTFSRLTRRGIPLKYRGDIWAECSGAKDLMVPGEYAEILTVHKDDMSPVMADIEKDVSRTFPGNVFFGGDGPGVEKLRRVLVAYSWYNPGVGYCQGMNMVAATLLLTHSDEEQAFWILICIIDRLLPANYFSPSLVGSRADQLVLSQIVAQILPKLHAHFLALGVDLASITFGWFLSLFTDCLPVETLFRVWDLFFVEGHDSIFRVAIAILKINEIEICNCKTVGDLFSFISTMTSRLWAADKLISLQHNFKPIIRHTDIAARCEKASELLEKEADDA
ncbi:hypothetical protein C351_02880 [Cryptococcus neoformans c8]|nr:hypothetical protein C353_03159 [Cryptococcus neoformans var. grubii AD1-83a]OXG60070.1 hypothetical protein C354_03096 [Cryptococcus neoformans var. grubii MW-RSA1955]OXG64368.1 hypothetical protein C351_02880 [Cryptococcus neoformans var. grubii c8]OXG65284.1 hypothetical protein C352_03105 [Cryptococcus neoformans var. grubii CHC193]OXH11378.1 hypothetical protein C369_03132 [Cryptococcus neoformans var. grubii A5-35-17]OXH12782.1 hypothetical protein C370_03152 [Cryptococcus neoformans 